MTGPTHTRILARAISAVRIRDWWRLRAKRAPIAEADPYWTLLDDDDGIQPADPYLNWVLIHGDTDPHREETAP